MGRARGDTPFPSPLTLPSVARLSFLVYPSRASPAYCQERRLGTSQGQSYDAGVIKPGPRFVIGRDPFNHSIGPVRPGKDVYLKRWSRFFETFPVGPNRSIEFWTEISGNFNWLNGSRPLSRFHYRKALE